MVSLGHIDEIRYLAFYGIWAVTPELVSDSEFDDIQLHLLECDECEAMARNCELHFCEVPRVRRMSAAG